MSAPPLETQKKDIWRHLRRASDKAKDLLKPPSRSTSHNLGLGAPLPGNSSTPASPASSIPSSTSSINLTVPGLPLTQPPGANAPGSLGTSPPTTPWIFTTSIDDKIPTIQIERDPEAGARKLGQSWAGLEVALRALHQTAKIFPPLHSAIGTLISCLDLVQAATENHQEYERLASDFEAMATLLEKHLRESKSISMSDCVSNIVRLIETEVGNLNGKKQQSVARRMVGAEEVADELVKCYRQIESLFRLLQVDASLSTWAITEEHLANTRLEAMSPAKAANYDSVVPANVVRNECTENTRTDVLAGMNAWSEDPAAAKVYWLNGMAGTGKTTIACSLSAALAERKQLGASFFCTRVLEECRDAARIIPTIVYQLARYSRPFQQALCKVLENDPDAGRKKIPFQFKRLLKEPLLAIQAAVPSNVVVVIDALDECDQDQSVRTLLDTLFLHAADLPIKFFVASRPEPEILDGMLSRGEAARSVLHLHEIERSSVQADIHIYLRKELAFMSPVEDELKQLVQLADNLFIYAATVVRYIRFRKKSVNPQERLRAVLATHSDPNRIYTPNRMYAELDELYRTILEGALDEEGLERAEVGRVRLVLWSAVCVREPVTVPTLAMLAGLGDENTQAVLQSLRSVLHISEASNLVTTLHASFPDFVLTRERSQHFFCDRVSHASLLATRCFEVMKNELRFNICKLGSSFIPDAAVTDLNDRMEKYISQSLSYACQYWGDHLSVSTPSDRLCVLLEDFLSNRLLFWMEVLNLTKPKNPGGITLQKIQSWLAQHADGTQALANRTKLLSDAHHFVTLFSSNPVSNCTPHIYVSVLPFCHKSSSVFAQYWRRTQGLMHTKGTAMEHQGSAALASWDAGGEIECITLSSDGNLIAFGGSGNDGGGMIGVINQHRSTFVVRPFRGHDTKISSAAFSPDGTRIVSGSSDRTICVWSSQDGKLVAGPLKRHTRSVKSVAFSPDGTHIASGSYDKAIYIWNAQTGSFVGGLLNGHTDWVSSVAFSPDGTRVVSGAFDKTICVWGLKDGRVVAGPLHGHTDSVCSVAFSPDDTHIVSGSFDKTICVWDANQGVLVAGPLHGHTDSVLSVAFSPDGTRIVSGSDDRTISVWSTHHGNRIASPLKGHTRSVKSVAFSPDGTRIISGSEDETICMWSAQDENLAAGSSKGHTRSVSSVAFSPDGTRIVSGSRDETICVWATHNGNLIVGPLKGHVGAVSSVAFSPSGTCIASGSIDKTVIVWNAKDGEIVAGPFRRHTRSVSSVAFSPDGTRIVSGSSDKTICVWSAEDGDLIAGPIKGHTGIVKSVAFSPDGTQIVSGSHDRTICVWSAQNGSLIIGPSKKNKGVINSVGFSPDGKFITSGSENMGISVWRAEDGKLIDSPLMSEADSVKSVAFLPCGTRIISGLADKTIRVWDTKSGSSVGQPFKGHTGSVNSVTCSPDGTYVASSSSDCSIRFTYLHEVSAQAPALKGDWDLKASGWVVDKDDQYLFWVPQHLRSSLPRLYNPLVIGLEGSLQVDYRDILLGDSWSKCFLGS